MDLTRPEEELGDSNYGLDALVDALDQPCSAGHATLLRDLAHLGGDEFGVLLENCTDEAIETAESLLKALQDFSFV